MDLVAQEDKEDVGARDSLDLALDPYLDPDPDLAPLYWQA